MQIQLTNDYPRPLAFLILLAALLAGCSVVTGCASSGSKKPTTGTVTDIDGNTYRTVLIGEQWWLAENMRATRFNDGVAIADGTTDAAGSDKPRFYQRQYEADSASVQPGRIVLYNWAAVTDDHSLAPTGWHIPSQAEWARLHDYISVSTGPETGESAPLLGPDSTSGFDALFVDAWFKGRFLAPPADQVNFWSITPLVGKSPPHAFAPNLGSKPGRFLVNNGANVLAGWGVRCIKDAD